MFKIILWRLYYHFLCFLKRIGYRGRRSRYFAYGANLDPQTLKRRNITPLSRTEYLLEDFELKFNHRIPFKGAAMASAEPAAGNKIPGVIYEIPRIDELRLDCMEGHPILNRYGKIILTDKENKCFYLYTTNRRTDGLAPTKAYLTKVLNGYRLVANASPSFLKDLESLETVDGFIPESPPYFILDDYERFGFLRPIFIQYDNLCVKVFAYLIFRPSIFESKI